MPRKPAHLEMIGGKNGRQRAWEAIRGRKGAAWTRQEIASLAKMELCSLESYLQGLGRAGIVTETHVEKTHALHRGCCKGARWYVLAQDRGVEAPRVTRDGREITAGGASENMWMAIRNFLPVFDAREVAAYAGTPDMPVPEATAKSFVQMLAEAGYLEAVTPPNRGRYRGALTRYRLLPHMNTGPRPPMVQRTKTVYDPNLGKVVWQEPADFDGELDHA